MGTLQGSLPRENKKAHLLEYEENIALTSHYDEHKASQEITGMIKK
jgi:hypothetical protein